MAYLRTSPQPPPAEIERFLGLNENRASDTELLLGESSYMRNFRIIEDYNMKKREGYFQLFESLGIDKPIRGMWYGKIADEYYFLFACDGNLYKHNTESKVNTIIGSLTDAETTFIFLEGNVYTLNGYEFKSFDGSVYEDVEGYIPTIAISTPPTGGGTPYEQANLLTGKKKQLFSGNGTATVFQLAETGIESVDLVEVDGTPVTPSSVDLTGGKVTLSSVPSDNTDNVKIQWTKDSSTDREQITKCRYGIVSHNRLHLWGNPDMKNTRFHSALPIDGSTTAAFFQINDTTNVGSGQYAITDIVEQYSNQIIFTESSSHISWYEQIKDAQGVITASFPLKPLNSNIGNRAFNQAQIVNNNPFSISKGIFEWISTNVADETNAVKRSDRVKVSLKNIDLSKAITVDWEENEEYWLCVGSMVYIYNYGNNTWYIFDNIPATCFLVIDGKLHFGTKDGQIMKFEDHLRNDNGNAINAKWEMHFYDFGIGNRKKSLNRMWFMLQPDSKVSVDIAWQTDNKSSTDNINLSYDLLDFNNLDFGEISFLSHYSPQPFRVKAKAAKKFTHFKLILESNSSTDTVTILSASLKTRVGGEVK